MGKLLALEPSPVDFVCLLDWALWAQAPAALAMQSGGALSHCVGNMAFHERNRSVTLGPMETCISQGDEVPEDLGCVYFCSTCSHNSQHRA